MTLITLTFRDLESLDFWEYAISQGSLFLWKADKPSLTVTISTADQTEEEQLEDFQENWGTITQEDLDADGDWKTESGITKATVTA